MQHSKRTSLMRDFDKVKSAINHPDNKHHHMRYVHNLIFLFAKKHGFACRDYRYALETEYHIVSDKLFEEKLNNKKNESGN
jgi:hypothetical protein